MRCVDFCSNEKSYRGGIPYVDTTIAKLDVWKNIQAAVMKFLPNIPTLLRTA